MDTTEKLLEMALYNRRVLGLTQDLKQIVISNKVESREFLAFVFKEVI
jgi:hypothetical protein